MKSLILKVLRYLNAAYSKSRPLVFSSNSEINSSELQISKKFSICAKLLWLGRSTESDLYCETCSGSLTNVVDLGLRVKLVKRSDL